MPMKTRLFAQTMSASNPSQGIEEGYFRHHLDNICEVAWLKIGGMQRLFEKALSPSALEYLRKEAKTPGQLPKLS